jgi:HrpA-like RNA helicase
LQALIKNQICLIKIGTGQGKSTLIPPLLLAFGFKKILVTQPRRMPCKLICKRVQKTFGEQICGWKVAGAGKNL